MGPNLLIVIAAAILLLLGSVHLLYTFRGTKLHPRDRELIKQMQASSPILTRDTTMWRAWIGFNASHSLGAILFGLVYGYLALFHVPMLFGAWFLLAVGASMLASFVLLAWRYWFSIPLLGAALALASFVSGCVWAWLRPAL